MDTFGLVTLVTLLSGAGGTGIGGVIGAMFKDKSKKTVSLLLAFAGGVMCAIVCFDLLEEAVEAAGEILQPGVWIVVFSVLSGVVVVYALNYLIDKRTEGDTPHSAAKGHPKTHDSIDELIHADNWAEHKRKGDPMSSLFIAGVVMACAIALHNLPEGMVIGSGFVVSDDMVLGTGMIMAVLIGVHNIPEGMAVSVPLVNGGMGRIRATLLTAACGVPTLLGAWLGLWLGSASPLGLCVSLGFASGAMLYVIFGELVPEAFLMYRSKAPAFSIIAGVLLGLVLIYI